MTTTAITTTRPGDHELEGVVCIGMPMAQQDNPVANKDSTFFDATLFIFLMIFMILFGTLCLIIWATLPSYRIESVSVSLDKNDIKDNQSMIRATWDVGFSVKHPGRGFIVSVRCMSSDWSDKVFRDVWISLHGVHATVVTSLPRDSVVPGLTLEYDVLFQNGLGEDFWNKAVCKNLSIGISSNATGGGGTMVLGGPRLCPSVFIAL